MEYSEVPQLIDFFKCEVPLRQERTQEYQSWSPSPYQLNGAIAEEEPEPEHPSGILVDFFKTGDGDHRCEVDAAVLNRSSTAGEDKHPMGKSAGMEQWSFPMAKGGESTGVVEQWSLPGALKLLSPTSTGTEESGTAAPKTPTFEMEIAYSRPDELDSTHQGSSGFQVPESGKVLQKDHHEHGQKRLKRVTPASIAPPSIRSEPLDQTPTSCFRDVCTRIPGSSRLQHDEETEVLVQAATSLLSLASSENVLLLTPSSLRRSMSSNENLRRWTSSDLEADEGDERCSSVLARPSNKRRYKLMVDLLAECPRVQRRKVIVT
jgi:hypothetical protein